MSRLEVHLLPSLEDNYIFLLIERKTQTCAVVDPGEASPVLKALYGKGLTLKTIFLTHHHLDHVGGVVALKEETGCQVVGYQRDQHRLPIVDIPVQEGASVWIGSLEGKVLHTPGHTLGHITYWFPQDQKVFVGDTLFSMGCGRLFEGTADMMWSSLNKLRHFPPETQVYCAHEYTLQNMAFAESLGEMSPAWEAYKSACLDKRHQNYPTVPTTLGTETHLNPFLAIVDLAYRRRIGLEHLSPGEAFRVLRAKKDNS